MLCYSSSYTHNQHNVHVSIKQLLKHTLFIYLFIFIYLFYFIYLFIFFTMDGLHGEHPFTIWDVPESLFEDFESKEFQWNKNSTVNFWSFHLVLHSNLTLSYSLSKYIICLHKPSLLQIYSPVILSAGRTRDLLQEYNKSSFESLLSESSYNIFNDSIYIKQNFKTFFISSCSLSKELLFDKSFCRRHEPVNLWTFECKVFISYAPFWVRFLSHSFLLLCHHHRLFMWMCILECAVVTKIKGMKQNTK